MSSVDALSSSSAEFQVVGDDGYVDLWTAVPARLTVTAYALAQRRFETWCIYGPDGLLRRIEALAPARPLGPIRKLLAYTIYNPRLETTVTYSEPRRYTVGDLKEALQRAVEQDNDILTQFNEANELRQQIDVASTHADLVNVVRRTRLPPDAT